MNDSIHGGLWVCQSTPLVQLQDRDRFGYCHLGVTQGSAFDQLSMGWINWLLGNPLDAVAIEITLGGFIAECRADGWLTLVGDDLSATLDGQPLLVWSTFTVRDGQRLTFAYSHQGARAYLATPGGFAGEYQLGSLATVAREGLGGPRADGKVLAVGGSLGWLADGTRPRTLLTPSKRIMDCTGEARLELIFDTQIGDFPAMSLFDALSGDWQMDTRASHMDVRLFGPRLECRQQSMISEGIALNAVQVPPDGQPVVLLDDRQTISGYPRLGILAPLALMHLAQCLPGQWVRLLPTVQEAVRHEHRRLLAAWDAQAAFLSGTVWRASTARSSHPEVRHAQSPVTDRRPAVTPGRSDRTR